MGTATPLEPTIRAAPASSSPYLMIHGPRSALAQSGRRASPRVSSCVGARAHTRLATSVDLRLKCIRLLFLLPFLLLLPQLRLLVPRRRHCRRGCCVGLGWPSASARLLAPAAHPAVRFYPFGSICF